MPVRSPRSPRAWVAAALLLAATGALAQQAPPIVEIDRVVAIVNDDVIVLSELESRLRTVRAQLRESGTPLPPPGVLRKQMLERLILDKLQLQVATQLGVRVDDETLNRAVSDIAARNKLTLREFRNILERDGFDFAKFREEVRNEILISQLRQRQVQNRVTVSDRDIENFLSTADKQGGSDDEYHLAQILIAVPEAASTEAIEAARTKAESLVVRLRDGADFAELAVAESDGQQALEGGDLGWRKAAELPTFFADVVPALRPGEISDPIRTGSGFHVLKLIEARGDERHLISQTHARHILVQINEGTTDQEARARLEQLKVRVENGESFTDLARSHSDDRSTAVNGGDLGWTNPGDLVPAFENAMNQLAPGGVSDPIKTRFGWHLIQVLERRQHDDTRQVRRSRAAEQIRRRKADEEIESWLRQLRDEAYVEVRLDEG